jgi:hypothetical protein
VIRPPLRFPTISYASFLLRRFGTRGRNGLRNPTNCAWLRPDMTIDSFGAKRKFIRKHRSRGQIARISVYKR